MSSSHETSAGNSLSFFSRSDARRMRKNDGRPAPYAGEHNCYPDCCCYDEYAECCMFDVGSWSPQSLLLSCPKLNGDWAEFAQYAQERRRELAPCSMADTIKDYAAFVPSSGDNFLSGWWDSFWSLVLVSSVHIFL